MKRKCQGRANSFLMMRSSVRACLWAPLFQDSVQEEQMCQICYYIELFHVLSFIEKNQVHLCKNKNRNFIRAAQKGKKEKAEGGVCCTHITQLNCILPSFIFFSPNLPTWMAIHGSYSTASHFPYSKASKTSFQLSLCMCFCFFCLLFIENFFFH